MGILDQWDCEHPGCESSAVGVGGALGLRAIGWYFVPGPIIFCPLHRLDPSEVKHEECDNSGPCSFCRAEQEAETLQGNIAAVTGVDHRAYYQARATRWAARAKNTRNT